MNLASATLTDGLTVFGALSPILLLGLGAYFKRALDKATARKTDAEAVAQLAAADKTRAEGESIILANTKLLIEQARAQQAEKDAMASERLTGAQVQIRSLSSRVNRMEEHFARLRAALATHGVWDASALVDLREVKPEYPEPPRLPMAPVAGEYHDRDDDIDPEAYFSGPTHRLARSAGHADPADGARHREHPQHVE